jgi:hypothetical protein
MTATTCRGGWTWGLGALLLVACPLSEKESVAPVLVQQPATAARALPGPDWVRLLSWGDGPTGVGLRPSRLEQPAQGPSAVAVGPGGEAYLLDRLNRRVLQATEKATSVAAQVPEDAEDLAVGPDGALAAYSPLRARVWLFEAGVPAGEIAVDRALREIQGFCLGASRQVSVHNAYQETYLLGSPSVPQTLSSVLLTKRKGAFLQADGTGVAVLRRADGHPEVLLHRTEERTRVVKSHLLPEKVLAARLVGVADEVACLRLEQALAGPAFFVERRVICLDLGSGARRWEQALPAPGLYLPRRELALGGSPPRLVFIRPEEKGLRVHSWAIPTSVGGQP